MLALPLAALALVPVLVGAMPFRQALVRDPLVAEGVPELSVHDAAGRRVCTLASGIQAPGPHAVPWNGMNDTGQPVPVGVYFFRLSVGGETMTTRLLLVR